MLKKTVTFDDYSDPPKPVTEDFYFSFTKLELAELDLRMGGVHETMLRLQETEDVQEAYELFKDLLLNAYGQKTPDGRGFRKSPEIREHFESSPALSEIVIEFLQDPKAGAQFVESVLPASMLADVKAEMAKQVTTSDINEMVAEAAERQKNPETAVLPTAPPVLVDAPEAPVKKFEDYTHEELLRLTDEEFAAIVPVNDPKRMSQDQLLVAFQRKNSKH